MSKLKYLIRRLLQPGMTLFTLGLFGLFLTAAVFAQPLFAYQSPDIIRLQERGQSQLEFNAYGSMDGYGRQDEILVKYHRQEYIRDLTEDYDPYLRAQLDALGPEEAPNPDIENKSILTYRNYLMNLRADADLQLRVAQGLVTDENYYFGLYAPSITRMMPLSPPVPIIEDISNAQAWESLIQASLESESPYLRAAGKNLQGQLPLRLDAFSASGLLNEMNRSFRFLLVLIPLACFLVLFQPKDRNLRVETPRLTGQKLLTVFLYSAAVVMAMRLLIYGFLSLRFGDAEGAMYVVPAWSGYIADSAAQIYQLRDYILYISLMDLGFLLFVSALAAVLYQLTGDPLAAAAAAVSSLLLPGVSIIPILDQLPVDPAFFNPFQYLFWDTRLTTSPELSQRLVQSRIENPLGLINASPVEVLGAILISSLVLLALIPLLSRLQSLIKTYRTARIRSIKPNV